MHEGEPSCALATRLGQAWRWREQRRRSEAPRVHSVHAQSEGRVIAIDDDGAWLFDGTRWTRERGWGGLANTPYLHAELRGRNLLLFHPRRTILIPKQDPGEDDGTYLLLAARVDTELTPPAHNPDGSFVQAEGDALWHFSAGSLHPLQIQGPEGVRRYGAVLRDAHDVLWVTSDRGVHRCPRGGEWEQVAAPAVDPDHTPGLLTHALRMPDGAVFLPELAEKDQHGLRVGPDGALHELPPWPRSGAVHHAAVSPDGVLVVALRYAGLLVLDGQRWLEVDPPGVVDSSTGSLTFSDSGHLVLANRNGSLLSCDLTSRRWEHVPLRDSPLGGLVRGVAPADERGVWVGTHEGLGRVRDGRVEELHQAAGDTGVVLRDTACLLSDGEGGLWVGGGTRFPGLLHYDGERWTRDTEHPELVVSGVARLRRDPLGRLHALLVDPRDGAARRGFLRRDDERWTWVAPEPDAEPRLGVRDITWMRDATPIVMTRDRVLRVLPSAWVPMARPMRLHAGFAALHADARDTLWLGYGADASGVAQLPAGELEWRLLDEGDWAHTHASAFTETADGTLWIASESGLYRVRDQESFRVGTDLVLRESAFSSLAADAAGSGLWIGSVGDGLLHHRPDDDAPPVVHSIHGDRRTRDGAQEFGAFWFASDHWGVTPREDLRFEYRLDGGPWLPREGTLHATSLTLGAFDVGQHSLEVAAIDASGHRSTEPARYSLEIPRPFWSSAPVLALAVLVVAALALVVAQFLRRRRERAAAHAAQQELSRRLRSLAARLMGEQEAERRRVARDLHDELGQSLAAARMQLQLIDRSSDPLRRIEGRERAREALDDAVQQMRLLARRLRPTVLDDHGLEAAVRTLAQDVAASHGLSVDLHIELGDPDLDEVVANHVFRIAGECLTNVTRHARARHVDLSLIRKDGVVQLSIQDDGVGMPEGSDTGRGIGMLGMQERAESLGGSFEIRSRRGRYTVVRVSIPATAPPGVAQGARPRNEAGSQEDAAWRTSGSFSSTITP